MAAAASTMPLGAPGIIPPLPSTNVPAGQQAQIPFRAASDQKVLILDSQSQAMTAAVSQYGPTTINGEGYIEEIAARLTVVTAANAAATAYTEDGKRAALVSFILNGPGGDIANIDAISLTFHNQYDGKQVASYEVNGGSVGSTDVSINQGLTGAGATGGSFVQWWRIPTAIGYRNLVGLLGNQDRATKYRIRDDFSPSTTVYSTPPTTLGTLQLTRYYTERVIPATADNFGNPQQVVPPSYGIIHYLFSEVNQTVPAPGTQTHYIQGLGNVFRRLALVFRQNASRVSAEATLNVNNAPAVITVFLGDNPIFTEDWAVRRRKMYDRYGCDAPAGVLVYDWANDFGARSGEELGDDLLNTQNLVNLRIQITYPAGIGTTNNSMTVIRDTLYVPGGTDLASVML